MLSFLSICPHPPIILPGVASKEDEEKLQPTIKAMEELSEIFHQAKIQTVILISPHGPLSLERMSLVFAPEIKSHLEDFGIQSVNLSFPGDLETSQSLVQRIESEHIPLRVLRYPLLDHGGAVPLYFLTKKEKSKPKVVELVYSALDLRAHLRLGKVIYQVAQESHQRIAFVASGDLSHRLTLSAPAGYSPQGKVFDKKILQLIKEKNLQGIIEMDPSFVEEAGECGYRSIVVLAGALQQMKPDTWTPEVLSYQGPFGVGYAVVNFRIHHE